MAELFTYKFRKMPVRIVRLDNGKNYFVIRDICNILGFSNPNRILAQYTENAPLYERIRTPGGLQVVRLVPREDVERILAPNNGRKALLLERWLKKGVFPDLEADEKAMAQVRSLVVSFVSAMHTLMTEQYFADKSGGCNGRCK
jgi:prophage antirepressor-like protein